MVAISNHQTTVPTKNRLRTEAVVQMEDGTISDLSEPTQGIHGASNSGWLMVILMVILMGSNGDLMVI